MPALTYCFSGDFNLRLLPYAVLWLFQTMVLMALHFEVGPFAINTVIMMTGLFSVLGIGTLFSNHVHRSSATERYWTQFVAGVVVLEFAWLCLIKFGPGLPFEARMAVAIVLFAAVLANMRNITCLDKLKPFSGLESGLTLVSAMMPKFAALDVISIKSGLVPERGPVATAIPTAWLIGGILVPTLIVWATGPKSKPARA